MSVPYRFETTNSVATVVDQYSSIDDGAETGVIVTLAGRLMLRRDQGKLVFGVLQDATGRIQLFASASWTTDFDTTSSMDQRL